MDRAASVSMLTVQLLYQQHKCNYKKIEQENTSQHVMFFNLLMCMTASFAMFMVQQHKRDRDTAK